MKKFLAIALAVLAMVSCKKQTELNFDDIAGKATVQGVVLINQGYQAEGANFVVKNVPAANREVVVKVPYKEYDSDAKGDKIFNATTDENGFFKVTIPVGQVALNEVYAETRPFTAPYYNLVNGEIQAVDAYYAAATSAKVTIESGKTTQVKDLVITKDITAPQNSRKQIVKIFGVVKNNVEKKTPIDKEDLEKGYKIETEGVVAEGVELTLTCTNSEDTGVELDFTTKTDANGAYSIDANLFDTWDITKVKVEIKTKAYVATAPHFYQKADPDDSYKFPTGKYSSQDVRGYYDTNKTSKNLTAGDLLIGAKLKDVVLVFTPDYATETIFGINGKINGEDIDYKMVEGSKKHIYQSTNPLSWAY